MRGYPTTYLGLFDPPVGDRPIVKEIEIPIIQRDFAQGRRDDQTSVIRERFLDTLIRAATTGEPMSLDFIYGDVTVDSGLLQPLDGQQRLTTLYLLHWYVASRAGILESSAPWLKFSYATRPTARDFTATLGDNPFLAPKDSPSKWITDQPWFVYPWQNDPTISSMLVILDAIHERFASDTDFSAVWSRLDQRPTADDRGAIWFLFLPVPDMQRGEDLYIKMNSRGRPLTAFEVFKADFESIIKEVDPGRYNHLAERIDGRWADVLWEYKKGSGDFIIDDEFMRYLTFIVEISEWRDGQADRKWLDRAAKRARALEERAYDAFASPSNSNALRNRDFFFHAFDTWIDASGCPLNPADELAKVFRVGDSGDGPLPLFSSTTDLFGACITKYGAEFSAQETLLLFAVLLARQNVGLLEPTTTKRRLRSIRNVSAAFLDRDRYMSEYVAATEQIICNGNLDDIAGFRDYWVADEAHKWKVMDDSPAVTNAIHEIEDSSLLRGRIQAFDLEPRKLTSRASAFSAVRDASLRDLLGAALLTKGDYSRRVKWGDTVRQLGSSAKDDSWMDLLTTGKREELAFVRDPLRALLDDVTQRMAAGLDVGSALEEIRTEWLATEEAEQRFTWRFYLARYSGARSAVGEGYFHNKDYDAQFGGFSYHHLRVLVGGDYTSHYRDALLHAAWVEGKFDASVEEPDWYWNQKETWIDPNDPGMRLKTSRAEVRCLPEGFRVDLPLERDDLTDILSSALAPFEPDEFGVVHVEQTAAETRPIDREDRVKLCIRLVKALLDAGF